MNIMGRAVHLGHGMNTDLMFPSDAIASIASLKPGGPEYVSALRSIAFRNATIDRHLLEGARFVVGGRGTGAGSSRQFAAEAIRSFGICGVIADSIHPVFYRTLWNIGMFGIEIEGLCDAIPDGAILSVDVGEGTVRCEGSERLWQSAQRVPPWFLDILSKGGLLPFLDGIKAARHE